ncbi:MAG: hypothetical protein LBI95_00780 [Holosporales bacterium]|jgi:hypothetical protein|nr:hypothetical protein [Holosporales bacterium]
MVGIIRLGGFCAVFAYGCLFGNAFSCDHRSLERRARSFAERILGNYQNDLGLVKNFLPIPLEDAGTKLDITQLEGVISTLLEDCKGKRCEVRLTEFLNVCKQIFLDSKRSSVKLAVIELAKHVYSLVP